VISVPSGTTLRLRLSLRLSAARLARISRLGRRRAPGLNPCVTAAGLTPAVAVTSPALLATHHSRRWAFRAPLLLSRDAGDQPRPAPTSTATEASGLRPRHLRRCIRLTARRAATTGPASPRPLAPVPAPKNLTPVDVEERVQCRRGRPNGRRRSRSRSRPPQIRATAQEVRLFRRRGTRRRCRARRAFASETSSRSCSHG